MIDLLFSFGAVAQGKTLLPTRRFDDSQDCLTFLRRQLEGFGRLRLDQLGRADGGKPAPWRSL